MAEIVVHTPDATETVDLNKTPIVIGRQKENDLVYDDEQLSRRHCEIRRENNRYLIQDLDSKNGTFVNGSETKRALLSDGDVIQIGEIELRFHQTTDASRAVDTSPGANTSTSPDAPRLITWVNPFQISTSSTSSNSGSYFLTALITGLFILLILFGGFLLTEPLRSASSGINLLASGKHIMDSPEKWRLTNASVERIDGDRRVFKLGLSANTNSSKVQFDTVPVRPDSSYTLSTTVQSRTLDGLAGVHVTWLGPDNSKIYEELALPIRENRSDWIKRSSDPLQPPKNARKLQLSFFASGKSGVVFLDQPVLRESRGSSQPPNREHKKLEGYSLVIDRSGQLMSNDLTGESLLQSGLRLRRNNQTAPGWAAVISNRQDQNNTTRWRGTTFTPVTFQPANFTLSLSEKEQTILTYTLPGSLVDQVDKIGFAFRYKQSGTSDGPDFITESGFVNPSESGEQTGVAGIRLPLANEPVLLTFSRPMTVRTRTDGENLLRVTAFLPVSALSPNAMSSGTNDLELDLTLSHERQQQPLHPDATGVSPENIRRYIQNGAYESALTRLRSLQPFERIEEHQDELEQLLSEVESRIEFEIRQIRETLETTEHMDSPALAEKGLKEAKEIERRLGSLAGEFEIPALKRKLREEQTRMDRTSDMNHGKELYEQFRTFRNAGKTSLAQKLAKELVARYPDRSFSEEAKSFLNNDSTSSTGETNGNGNSN